MDSYNRLNNMRNIITILLLLLPLFGWGQSLNPKPSISASGQVNTLNIFNGGTQANIYLRVPLKYNCWAQYDSTGMVWLDSATKVLYYHNGTNRVAITGGSGSGTVTSIVAGFGLTGGNITTSGTINVNPSVIATKSALDSVAGLITPGVDSATLSDSLALKVPYSGATGNVNIGEYYLRSGAFVFDTTPSVTTYDGYMFWDSVNKTAQIKLNGEVMLQVGQETMVRARNNTGLTIANGAVVYINGAQGNNPTVALANADSASTSTVIGIATEDILDNETGYVTVTGVVNGVNTSTWNTGDRLYLSTTHGQLTNIPPAAPHISVSVGMALNSTNNGRIFVRPSVGVATDTLMNNGTSIAPTQYAVKSYVNSRGFLDGGDTVSLSNRINTKQNFTDTTTWDATRSFVTTRGYLVGSDTVSLSNRINLKLNSADTVSLSNRINLKLNSSDTASLSNRINLKLNSSDTASLSNRINSKQNFTDTSTYDATRFWVQSQGYGTGSVTSIRVVGGTGATVTPTTTVTTSGTYTVTPEVSAATFNTLTNKRITYRNSTAASYTTSVTIPSDSVDMFIITAQAGALLFNAPSGTPTEGQMLLIRIKDNGTARALTWNAIWRSGTTVTLPTTTTLSRTLYMEFLYNSTDARWDIVGVANGY